MIRVLLIGKPEWCERMGEDINSCGTHTVAAVSHTKNIEGMTEDIDLAYVEAAFGDISSVTIACNNLKIPLQIVPDGVTPRRYVKDERLIQRLVNTGLIRQHKPCSKDEGQYLVGKRILITGAGGSIGSDLARKIAKFSPVHVVLVDNSENGVYEVNLEMEIDGFTSKTAIVADIRDRHRVRSIMQEYKPDIVFHIAARKHVPLMERFPEEAVTTNISGTIVTLEEAEKAGVKLFTFISTDKAADPANVMGATKRIAERVIQRHAKICSMKHCIVRFENVLDSDGNVVYTFLRQLRRGGNLTVTSPKMNRYFITREHASTFIIRASGLADCGEVFVPDAGPPINISKLATTIGGVMGYKEGINYRIIYTQPRPGEKMSEELVTEEEMKRQKELDGLFMIPPVDNHPADFDANIESIQDAAAKVDRAKMLELISKLEPTYKP